MSKVSQAIAFVGAMLCTLGLIVASNNYFNNEPSLYMVLDTPKGIMEANGPLDMDLLTCSASKNQRLDEFRKQMAETSSEELASFENWKMHCVFRSSKPSIGSKLD